MTLTKYLSWIIDFWQNYKKNRPAVFGLLITFIFIVIAILAPFIVPSPFLIGTNVFVRPSLKYPMGTDDLGRNILNGIVHGTRVSLTVGFVSALTSMIIGIFIGAISGYCVGKIDDLLMRITEAFQVTPILFLTIVIVSFFGATMWNIAFVIGILGWPRTARLVRAQFLSLRKQEFVVAATALGSKKRNIIFSEILPNAISPAIVYSSLQMANAILLEAGLGFLGLSDPNVMSWGFMIKNAQQFLRRAWWMAIFPGFSISLVVIGLNLIGDGLNDALNPRLRAIK